MREQHLLLLAKPKKQLCKRGLSLFVRSILCEKEKASVRMRMICQKLRFWRHGGSAIHPHFYCALNFGISK